MMVVKEIKEKDKSTFVGTLRLGTLGPRGQCNSPSVAKSSRKSFSLERERSYMFGIGGRETGSSGIT